MSKTHEAISKEKTQTWPRILTHHLPLYFPEIERCDGNSRSDWFMALLERCPTPQSMSRLGQEAFTRQAWTLIGRKVSKARLINDIYVTAYASVALPVDKDSMAGAMFCMVITQIRGRIRRRVRIPGSSRAVFRFDRARRYEMITRSVPRIVRASFRIDRAQFEVWTA